nr:unnamed protein product [Callosobruchus analis]
MANLCLLSYINFESAKMKKALKFIEVNLLVQKKNIPLGHRNNFHIERKSQNKICVYKDEKTPIEIKELKFVGKRTIVACFEALSESIYYRNNIVSTTSNVTSLKSIKSSNTRLDRFHDKVSHEEITQIEWTQSLQRTGVTARKIGIYPLWFKDGKKITTLLQVLDNHVIKYYSPEEFDPSRKRVGRVYKKQGCLLLGTEAYDPSTLTREYCSLFKDSAVIPK